MNILLKCLLLQTIFVNTYTNVYSVESFYNSSETSHSCVIINRYIYDTMSSSSSVLSDSQQYDINNMNNIYNPNIEDYIQNKYKDRIEIINEKKYVGLTIEELCKCIDLNDKYINTKQKIDNFHCKLKLISQEITSLEANVKLKKNENNNTNSSEFLKKYITNSLKNTIDYQVNLRKLISSVINKLNNLKESVTENNIKESIDKYYKITSELLQDNHNGTRNLYKNYIDKLCREIDFSYSNNKECELNNKQLFNNNLLKDFKVAHDNFIEALNNNLKNINIKISTIVDNILQEMKQNSCFIFTVDKYNCRKNYLINEIYNLTSDFKNHYDIMTNLEVKIPLRTEIKSYESILLNKLELYEKRLITNPLSKLKQILQKDIIFNCNNKENIEKFQKKMNKIQVLVNTIK